jgi:hypothetical protein
MNKFLKNWQPKDDQPICFKDLKLKGFDMPALCH